MPYKDRDEKRASKRRWYHRHRDARAAYSRAYRVTNLDAIRERERIYNARKRAEHRARANALKLAAGCIDCGFRADNPAKLDFDHVAGEKISCLSDMIAKDWSWPKIAAEIAKCVVRCKPCHRGRHHRPVEW